MKNSNTSEVATIPFIMKRSFLGSSIGIVIFAPLFVIYAISKFFPSTASSLFSMDINSAGLDGGLMIPPLLWLIFVYIVIAAIYFFIVNHIQFVERAIRLYTGSSLKDVETMGIAKKIFKDSFKFKVSLFIKYYLVPTILGLIALGFGLFAIFSFAYSNNQDVSIAFYELAVVPIAVLVIWAYVHYYLFAKLRYVWFSYLNNYGEENSTAKAFFEMNSLNALPSDGSFKKAMTTEFKNEMLGDAAAFGTGTLASQIPGRGALGELGKEVVGGYSAGMSRDIASYATLEAKFNLYKEAYSKLFNKDFVPNMKITEKSQMVS